MKTSGESKWIHTYGPLAILSSQVRCSSKDLNMLCCQCKNKSISGISVALIDGKQTFEMLYLSAVILVVFYLFILANTSKLTFLAKLETSYLSSPLASKICQK